MPPVELNTIPTSEAARQSFSDLKLVEKVLDIPVVNDTISELEKVKNTISENSRVQSVNQMIEVGRHMVEEGIQKIKDNDKVNAIVENERITESVTSVKDVILPKMNGALDKLDHLACDGIDSLTSAIPALNSSAPELYLSTKDAAMGYFLWATEYVASFTASQISLSLADTSLSVAEKVTSYVKPQEQNEGLASSTYTRIRGVRRSLRAVKRAGARLNPPAVAESSLFSRIASMYYVNALLCAFGVQLVPDVKEKTRELLDDSYSHLEDLKGDLDGYKSEEDPDYETESDEDSIDGSDDEAEEEILGEQDSSEDEEEENDVSEPEARQVKHIKDEVVDETCGLGDQCCTEGTCEMGAEV